MLTALETEDKLGEWERSFVASLMDRFYRDEKALTQAQFDKLEEVYRRYY